MVLNHKLLWTGICFLGFLNLVVLESVWTDWVPIGVCTAIPCNCNPEKQNETCSFGYVREVRFCNRSAGDPPCQDESEDGPTRIDDKCVNNGVNCPGWSEWRDTGLPCNCMENGTLKGQVIKERVCDNPPFMYGKLKCFVESNKKMDGELQRAWMPDERCICEVTTLKTTMPTTPITTNKECVDAFAQANDNDDVIEDYQDGQYVNEECEYTYYG